MHDLFSAFEQINSQSVFVFYLSKFSICGCYAPQMQTSMLKKLSSFDSITRKNRLMLKVKKVCSTFVTIVHENVFSVCLVPIFIVKY